MLNALKRFVTGLASFKLGKIWNSVRTWDDTICVWQTPVLCVYRIAMPFMNKPHTWCFAFGQTLEAVQREAGEEFMQQFLAECGNANEVSTAELLIYARDLQRYLRQAQATPFEACLGFGQIANERLPVVRQALIERGIFTIPA